MVRFLRFFNGSMFLGKFQEGPDGFIFQGTILPQHLDFIIQRRGQGKRNQVRFPFRHCTVQESAGHSAAKQLDLGVKLGGGPLDPGVQ